MALAGKGGCCSLFRGPERSSPKPPRDRIGDGSTAANLDQLEEIANYEPNPSARPNRDPPETRLPHPLESRLRETNRLVVSDGAASTRSTRPKSSQVHGNRIVVRTRGRMIAPASISPATVENRVFTHRRRRNPDPGGGCCHFPRVVASLL